MKKQTASKDRIESKSNSKVDAIHDFSVNLRKAVEDTGLTAYALGKKIGVDDQVIQKIIHGGCDPNFSTVARIVKGMQLSMDKLLGIVPVKLEEVAVPSQPVSEVEIKMEKIGFINKIVKMHDQDVELLEAVAGILDDRRSCAIAKLLHAVNDVTPSDDKKGLMAKAVRSMKSPQINKSLSKDDFLEDDDFDDDFEDEDDLDYEFDDDDIFDDDDDDFDDED